MSGTIPSFSCCGESSPAEASIVSSAAVLWIRDGAYTRARPHMPESRHIVVREYHPSSPRWVFIRIARIGVIARDAR